MAERKGLSESTDLDAVVLELAQIPVAAWVPVLLVGMFGTMVLGAMLAPPVAGLAFLGCLVVLLSMPWIKPKLRMEITPTEIRLSGWMGQLPVPRKAVLPVLGTTLTWTPGALVNGVQVWVLSLSHGEETLVAPSLRCTQAELDAVRDRLEGMRMLASALHGEGEEEVPEELAALRASRRIDERNKP